MKLRNSFISLKTLSDELNVPIVATTSLLNEKQKITIVPADYEHEHPAAKLNRPVHDLFGATATGKPPSDKSAKTVASHVKNLKKSMLNDNRLLKLRNKFLKRSKSSPGMKEDKSGDAITTEENQNKENECPKLFQHEKSPIVMSPNRNRVKMGTRVFSAQFLNKSYENIYPGGRSLDDCEETDYELGKTNGWPDERHEDGLSLKSTSLSSLYFSEKMSEKYSESPLPSEAYVIRKCFCRCCFFKFKSNNYRMFSNADSSIKSCYGTNYLTLANDETVSDSLLDKFNNISSNIPTSDRIITKITIIKENPDNHNLRTDQQMSSTNIAVGSQLMKGSNSPTLPSNNNSKWIKEHLLSPFSMTSSKPNNVGNLFLSRSQESIFTKTDKLTVKCSSAINQNNSLEHKDSSKEKCMENGYTLGISIVQGSDQHVYVKDLVKNGPGERNGIQIGDQVSDFVYM